MIQPEPIPWEQPGWLESVLEWIKLRLVELSLPQTGPVEEVHRRPWSVVLRVPAARGDLYFKAAARGLSHEPALSQALAQWRPDCTLPVLAADLQRGWMLLPDGGPTLRSLFEAGEGFQPWLHILPLYADLQIDLSGRLQQILALGVPDRRLSGLPLQLEQLLQEEHHQIALTDQEHQRLNDALPEFRQICTRLAAFPLPETLHHDDFHDGNVFASAGRYMFFDWGESCAAHPFFSMVVGLRGIAYRFGLAHDDPVLLRLRDAYLEPWQRFAPRPVLLEAFHLAQVAGAANRALTWYRVVSPLPEPQRSSEASAVPGWLLEFLTRLTAA
jgi:hypothetical protein